MPQDLVLLDGDGHTWVCLDYRQNGRQGEPTVAWIDNEMNEDVQIAPNFASFLDGLINLDADVE